jgi:hypothetical protein
MKIHLLVGFSFVEGALDRNPEQGFIRRHLPAVDDGGRWSEANTNSLWAHNKKRSASASLFVFYGQEA